MGHQIHGRERGESVEALVTALTQQPASAVHEADSVLFQLYHRGDVPSSGATRNSGMEFARSAMALTMSFSGTTEQEVADHDVQDEHFNEHRWTDDKNTVSIYTELDELNDPVAERRRQYRTIQGNVAKPSSAAVSHGSPHVNLISTAIL